MSEKNKAIVLRSIRNEEGFRYLSVEIDDAGNLLIRGQDLGKGVSEFFGADQTEYEWDWTIRKEDISSLLEALGGCPGDDVLALLEARFSGEAAAGLGEFLEKNAVPVERWSRIGD